MSNPDQMVMGTEAFDCGIQKRLIYAGKNTIEYADGTKVLIFFLNFCIVLKKIF